jgi:hypothetical protein
VKSSPELDWHLGENDWPASNRVAVGLAGQAPPGAPVTLVAEPFNPNVTPTSTPTNAVLDAFFVGNDGAVYRAVSTMTAGATAPTWSRPTRITDTRSYPAGAKVAAVAQGNNTLDAFVVDVFGRMQVLYSNDNGPFQSVVISNASNNAGFARGTRLGSGVYAHWSCYAGSTNGCAKVSVAPMLGSTQWLVLTSVDVNGALNYFTIPFHAATGWGPWTQYVYGAPGMPSAGDSAYRFSPTADVESTQQWDYQVDTFAVGADGSMNVLWMDEGPNVMYRYALSPTGFAPSGSWLATACEIPQNYNNPNAAPYPILPGCAGAYNPNGLLDVMVIGNDSALDIYRSAPGGWQGVFTGTWSHLLNADGSGIGVMYYSDTFGLAAPGSPIAAAHQDFLTIDALSVGAQGVNMVFTVANPSAPLTPTIPWGRVARVY